ncbi:MAG: hypothetical protein U0350_26335 [Caldilineaceae bacterium]
MSALAKSDSAYSSPTTQVHPQAQGGLVFDWVMVVLSLIYTGGLYLDGWAHNHGKVDQSFFTVWHAFFYSGFALVAFWLTGALLLNRFRGCTWAEALPAGYQSSLLGVLVFAAGGVGDLIWHEIFGIEESFDALVSPTHLMLGIGLALVVSGPLRAAWQQTDPKPGWRALGPALLSATCLISALTFFMMFSHPLMSIIGGQHHYHFNNEIGQVAGVVSILFMTGLLLGPTFLLMRRWTLVPGSLTLVWGVNTVAMAIINWELSYAIVLTAAMLVGVVAADFLYCWLKPSVDKPSAWRLFAFCAPVLLFGAYFLALLWTEGSVWTVHLLSGTVVLSGVVGWLLSYLVVPPQMPQIDPK